MIGEGDVAAIMASGDFDEEADFDGLAVRGWFTGPTDETVMFGQVQIEAQKPSFMCPTDQVETVRTKTPVTVRGTDYTVERKQVIGQGVSVVYLKTLTA